MQRLLDQGPMWAMKCRQRVDTQPLAQLRYCIGKSRLPMLGCNSAQRKACKVAISDFAVAPLATVTSVPCRASPPCPLPLAHAPAPAHASHKIRVRPGPDGTKQFVDDCRKLVRVQAIHRKR